MIPHQPAAYSPRSVIDDGIRASWVCRSGVTGLRWTYSVQHSRRRLSVRRSITRNHHGRSTSCVRATGLPGVVLEESIQRRGH